MSLKYGCDPEVFSTIQIDGERRVISPALMEKFSGLKRFSNGAGGKHPEYISTDEYVWMQDGAAFEITLKRPYENPMDMYEILQTAKNHLAEFLAGYKYEGMEISLYDKPVVGIDPSIYMKYIEEPDIYQGFIFGCDPDHDAFRPEYVCDTIDVASHLFRYGGGHIHVSGNPYIQKFFIATVKLMAITVGNFITANSPYPEQEKQRALTYGRPGRYREQYYPSGEVGVEYRTPSNSWTSFSKEKAEELFYWVRKAIEFTENRRGDIIKNFAQDTITAITQCDKNLAMSILQEVE